MRIQCALQLVDIERYIYVNITNNKTYDYCLQPFWLLDTYVCAHIANILIESCTCAIQLCQIE